MLNIIDGYNFIFKIPRLEALIESVSLEKAREELLSLLSRYKLISKQDFTVVFDGRGQKEYQSGSLPASSEFQGVKVLFSKDVTADEDIISLMQVFPNPKEITIVTSDNGILNAARRRGCHTSHPEEFYKKITHTLKKEKFTSTREPSSKFQELQEHEVKYWLKYFQERLEGEGK
ncbi:MAG TPA: NYN domain-containing protein [Candidatus Hypogeohydataceae bacterium YC41]